ncbi:MAG: response regulator [Myxococcota bacterium]|nr:response regulator [Myxococcota bacterium]
MSRRVLIVDDNRELAESLAELLAGEGLEPLVRDDAQLAVRDAPSLRFDAALLDARMPGVDGLELVRQLAPHAPHAVYVLMTAFPREAQLAHRDARVRRVLAKPFGPDVLIAALRDTELMGAARR